MASSTNVSSFTSGEVAVVTFKTIGLSSFQSLKKFAIQNVSAFQSILRMGLINISRYASIPVNSTLTTSKNRVFTLEGNSIFARDSSNVVTKLGFIEASLPQILTDVALADGIYELEVRPSGSYYKEVRGKKLLSVTITGGVVEFSGIPFIQNLQSLITTSFVTRVIFDVGEEFNLQDISFGVWRSTISPVDVSGLPDFTVIAINGIGRYKQDFQQTEPEFVAVAALTDTEQGQESEIALPWDSIAPPSPTDQFSPT